jgi:formylglycine-generating enzyme required for sulfatase activity
LYSFDDEVSQLGEYAWYDENSGDTTHPVGQKKPNAWGLYDMHGNVWEWVEDGKRAYTAHAITDPKGPTDAGAGRVIRGGGWFVSARVARSAFRVAFHPGYRDDYLGFRCLSSGTGR